MLIVAATPFEIAALQEQWPPGSYHAVLQLEYFVCGVGPVASGITLTEQLCRVSYDMVLNVGVAGALDSELALGEVVQVVADSFGDIGAEEASGAFVSVHELGLAGATLAPAWPHVFTSDAEHYAFAKHVIGVTVATVHGEAASIARFRKTSDAQVESMEGATVAWVAFRQNTQHLQLRAISNYVEPRNRDSWKLELALKNLTEATHQLLSALPGAVAARSAKLQLNR